MVGSNSLLHALKYVYVSKHRSGSIGNSVRQQQGAAIGRHASKGAQLEEFLG